MREEVTLRIAWHLFLLLRLAWHLFWVGRTHRQRERLPPRGGGIELKIEHALLIVRAIGLHPAEFFEPAYPRRAESPPEAFRTLRTLVSDMCRR